MRNPNPAFAAALTGARDRGILPRKFFWVTVRDRVDGSEEEVGLWSGDDTITVDVISGQTGLPVTRTYVGGVDLQVGNIPRVSDMTIQTIDVSVSAIDSTVQLMVRGYDARLAPVEIHTGVLDPDTRLPVSPAEVEFLGQIDEAPIETAAVGGESRIPFAVRSDGILMLTRTNPKKRSYEAQKRRQGDEWGLYANSVGTWRVPWGEEAQGTPPASSRSKFDEKFFSGMRKT
ncbi:hypothetical protein [Nitratireductor luteus]|uniref:hypothetical protein n=1 Tax=Nitratireductor luteus TaxID=2976980 RepID=UPI00223FC612|nr:hypothetical protein [Nitratireductor luteus]